MSLRLVKFDYILLYFDLDRRPWLTACAWSWRSSPPSRYSVWCPVRMTACCPSGRSGPSVPGSVRTTSSLDPLSNTAPGLYWPRPPGKVHVLLIQLLNGLNSFWCRTEWYWQFMCKMLVAFFNVTGTLNQILFMTTLGGGGIYHW